MVRTVRDDRQLPLIIPESSWELPSAPPSLKGARRIAVDVETKDPELKKLGPGTRRGAQIVGLAVGIDDGPRVYMPVRHEGGCNMDVNQVFGWARDELASFDGDIVGHELLYDLDFLAEEGVEFDRATFRDSLMSEAILNEYRRSYSLESICQERLGEGKDETLLREAAAAFSVDPKSGLWRLPGNLAGPYGEGDVDRPLRLIRAQEREIDAQDLRQIYELEHDLIPLFLAMKRRGVPIDQDRLDDAARFFADEEAKATAEIKRLTQVNLENAVWVADACGQALGAQGIAVPSTTTGKASVKQDWLESLPGEVPGLIVRARKMNKARTTFVAQIRDHMVKGRIHPNYNPLRAERAEGGLKGTISGRPSMDHPNLLFMPVRDDEIGPRFRAIFIPEPGEKWAKNDVSQQEPRLLVHFAVRTPDCRRSATEAAERIRADPNIDYHSMIAELTGLPRQPAKQIFLGTCYGMGGGKLCREYLNLPTEWKSFTKRDGQEISYEAAGPEGQEIMDAMHRHVPFLKKMDEVAKARASTRGYITTLLGRRCRFPIGRNGEREQVRKALNKLIQGSAADQTKKAMLDVWRELGIVPYIQVYDELGSSVPDEKTGHEIGRVMRDAVELEVPTKIDTDIGPSWGMM